MHRLLQDHRHCARFVAQSRGSRGRGVAGSRGRGVAVSRCRGVAVPLPHRIRLASSDH